MRAFFVVAALATLPMTQAPERPDVSERGLVAAATKYVVSYEKDFAFLIADEQYEQTRLDSRDRMLQRRVMRSELFLTYLPGDEEWIAVRDAIDVDGVPIKDRDDLRTLLSRKDGLRGVASQIVERNARFNIGAVERNFNEPTLALLLLEPRRAARISFDRTRVERQGDVTLATLAYEERDGPTLVAGRLGPARAKGEFVVEAGTGVVRRTTFELSKAAVKVRLVTSYEKDAKLGLWLPTVFTERYELNAAPREVIVCEARYTNYRRFDVIARIK